MMNALPGIDKDRVTLVFLGDVSAGKSTILGHLSTLVASNHIELARVEAEAAESNKRSNRFAWVLDKEPHEREHGTTECKLQRLDTEKHTLSLVDVPGDPQYQQEIISGISSVDAAVLVVDATEGAFERGMRKEGQTREHVLLAYVLGVKHVVVAVTKLDAAEQPYGKKRFEECRAEVARYMKRVGYVPERIACIPVSGLHGDNLICASSNTAWYKGPSLLESIDTLDVPKHAADKPLRVALYDVIREEGQQICMGRVTQGTLAVGMTVRFTPGNVTTEVKSLEVHQSVGTHAVPGDVVGFTVAETNLEGIGAGCVVSEKKNDPAQVAASFVAQVILLNAPVHITPGFEFLLDVSTAHVRCRFEAFIQKIDRRSGKVMEENPAVMKAGDVMFCSIRPLQPVCVEALARFCIRSEGVILAVGLVKSVEYESPPPVTALSLPAPS